MQGTKVTVFNSDEVIEPGHFLTYIGLDHESHCVLTHPHKCSECVWDKPPITIPLAEPTVSDERLREVAWQVFYAVKDFTNLQKDGLDKATGTLRSLLKEAGVR